MEFVKVDERVVLLCFCLIRQAERSVDHVLFDEWEKLKSYYSGERLELLHGLIKALPESNCGSRQQVIESMRARAERASLLSSVRAAACSMIAPKSFRHHLQVDTIAFIRAVLEEVESRLNGERPSNEVLVRLRMDLHLGEMIIQSRFRGMDKLEEADMIENFNMPLFLRHYSVDEIVPDLLKV